MPAIYTSIIVPGIILLPITIALIKKKHWGQEERTIFLYLLTSCLFNTLASLLAARGYNNLPLLHLYTLLEFFVITRFFYITAQSPRDKKMIRWLWVIFPVLALINIFYLHSIFLYNLIPRSIAGIIIIILCIHFLMKSLSFSAGAIPFFNFGIVVSFLLYFSGSLALFALSDFIIADRTINQLIWNTHATFVLIMYLIIAVSYYKTNSQQ